MPDNRKINPGIEYLAEEFKAVGASLSEIAGKEITDEALQNSIAVFNQHKTLMHQFLILANDHLDIITPYYRHMVVKSSFFMPREKHSQLLNELITALQAKPVHQWSGKKVVVTGIMMEPYSILNMLSDFNLAVVRRFGPGFTSV